MVFLGISACVLPFNLTVLHITDNPPKQPEIFIHNLEIIAFLIFSLTVLQIIWKLFLICAPVVVETARYVEDSLGHHTKVLCIVTVALTQPLVIKVVLEI